ncbi:hypothetical protein AAFC00_002919 [Neodothiora populina]|uniref:Ubiquitin-conjugating enzyme E2 2 n=1 Tax=Neodothiora populina TaxID=2781224 RepID=A0ABR3P8Y5_9PEZI
MAEKILMSEFKAMSKEPWTNIELVNENIFEWSVALIVMNPGSPYNGGYLKAEMRFPKDYPFRPPEFRFLRPLWHPNIYLDGRLCISILHQPGHDEMSGELADERWSPAQRVETVLISILSLLDDAEVSSPANVDAGVMLRNDPEKYKDRVWSDLEQSKKDIPEGFVMPTEYTFTHHEVEANNFTWSDSEDEYDFGGSDSEAEMTMDEDDDNADEHVDTESSDEE